ncbi:MAG: short-chain dehydrogenase/reductase [Ilumatobacteraceae bacterium]|nr:short-chain dehydrogenase/reductase [Ilumatobacteraceae bacterium]
MSLFDAFKYDGLRVVVVGAATGMGNAVARLVQDAGATVVAMDRADFELDGATIIRVDLADKASIEAAVGQCGGRVDALFSCAGVADGTPGIERINFIGHRHMIKEMIGAGMLGRGSAIGLISSAGGLGWDRAALPELLDFLKIEDFDEAAAWCHANGKADYRWSKQAVNTYVAHEAFELLKLGIRINAILPGPTDTPLAQANAATWLGFGTDYRAETGVAPSTPLEQAYPLVFLCSPAAAAITGITVVSDAGYFSSGLTESFPPATGITNYLSGRM